MLNRLLSILARYGVALAIVAMSLICRALLVPWLNTPPVFMPFLLGVMLAALIGGFGPGLFVTVSLLLTTAYFFVPPLGSLAVADAAAWDLMGLFALEGVIVSALAGYARSKKRQVEHSLAEAKITTEALETRDRRFEALIEKSHDTILILSPDGQISYASPSVSRLFGFTRHELTGKNVLELVHPDDQQGIRDGLANLAGKPGETTTTRCRNLRKDGTSLWLEGSSTNLLHEPTINGIVCNVRDISAQKRSEDRIKRSEEQLRRLLDGARDYAILMLDVNGRIMSWSAGAERIKGYTTEEALGMDFSRFFPPEAQAAGKPSQILANAAATGRHEDEGWRVRKNGSRFWAVTVVTPLYDGSGRLEGYTKVSHDLSERKTMETTLRLREEALQRTNERIGNILSSITEAYFALDHEFRLVDLNAHVETLFGKRREQVLGRFFWEVFPDGKGSEFERQFRQAMVEQRSVHFEALSRIAKSTWFETHAYPSKDGLAVYFRDITTRKRIEAEHKSAMEAAEAANRAKSSFLANMSHEIRTPLGAILGFAEFLVDESLPLEERSEFAQRLIHNGTQLVRIIDDILDLSKVEAGRLDIERLPVATNALVEDVFSSLEQRAVEKGLDFSVNIAPDVPSQVLTDPTRLRQILMNIVGNALKFTENGGVHLKVCWDNSREKLLFEVKDSGPGLSETEQDRLFQAFTQADTSTTRRYGGTGLGLVLSRRLARLLGGDVVLSQSTPGQGSVFTASIAPRADAAKALAHTAPESVDRQKSIDLSGVRVLVVEDAPDLRLVAAKVLRRAGASVDTANDGREGADLALKGQYDVVLMDLQMPRLDGYAATAQLRSQGYRLPIVALTAHALVEERTRVLASGFNGHVAKPIDQWELLSCVAKWTRPAGGE